MSQDGQDRSDGRNSKGQFAKGTSGNPSGLPRAHADAHVAARPPGIASPDDPDVAVARLDGWASALTGINSSGRDKRMSATFETPTLGYQELIELYRGDDVARRAVAALPEACFAQGFELTIADEGSYEELKEDVEEELDLLGVEDVLQEAMCVERWAGGSAILLGVADGRPLDAPLDESTRGKLEFLNVLEPIELYPEQYYDDPAAPKFGQPRVYRLQTFTVGGGFLGVGAPRARGTATVVERGNQLIHESRLIVYPGVKVSRYQSNFNQLTPLWGDSVLVRLRDVLRDFNVAWSAAGLIATDVSQPVIKIENLMGLVAKQPEKLRDRFAAIELSRSVARAIAIDSKEEYVRQTTSLSGVPELLHQISRRTASALETPLSRLMGDPGGGLGKEADGDTRRWYDQVMSTQRRRVRPPLRKIIRFIIRSMRERGAPKKWDVKFRPLWTLTDAEIAEARFNQARTDSLYVKAGVLTPDEVRESRFVGEYSYETQVDEAEEAPGFIAPLPAGVMPGTSPAAGVSVQPHARRAPSGSPQTAAAKTGVEASAGAERADADGTGAKRVFAGLPIVVESPKGSTREWVDTDGGVGKTRMRYDYGFVEGAVGADGDSVDVYLGPSQQAPWVYVVHQMSKATEFAEYDEDKVMLGFDSPNHARDAYLRQYDDDRFLGGMSMMTLEDFVARCRGGGPITWARMDRISRRAGRYVVTSRDGRRKFGDYASESEALERLREVERLGG